MVTLTYTCPKSGIVIIGGKMTEQAVMRCYNSDAQVKCLACRGAHQTKVRELRMYRAAERRALPVPLKAS